MHVFQEEHHRVGLGRLFSFRNMPILNNVSIIGLIIFAKYHTYFTRGRVNLDELVRTHEENKMLEIVKNKD